MRTGETLKDVIYSLDPPYEMKWSWETSRSKSNNTFNDTATTEIYTILFVGSVRCV